MQLTGTLQFNIFSAVISYNEATEHFNYFEVKWIEIQTSYVCCPLLHSYCVISSLKPDSRRSNYSCSVTNAEVTLNTQNNSAQFVFVINELLTL